MTRLLLVRHGRSELNAERRVQGWLDSPLDDVGRLQARAVARRVQREGPEVVYTSSLRRAGEMAEIVAEQLEIPLVVDERLKERGVGVFAGLTAAEIKERYPGFLERWRESRTMVAPPEGEQPEIFWSRVVSAFDDIVACHPGGVVVVVTHGGVLATYFGHLLGTETGRWAPFSFGNGSLSIVEFNEGSFRIRVVNDRCHLDGEE